MKLLKFDHSKVVKGVEQILEGLGVDWKNEENFVETPERVARAFKEFTVGFHEEFNNIKTFSTKYDGMIFFKSIKATGLCPHHLLPITYDIAFAYVPNKKVVGLSKISRIIKHICARPDLQEDVTKEITEFFEGKLSPKGVAVLMKGIHGCMRYRGVKEADEVRTVDYSGVFTKNENNRVEFYAMINEKV